MRQANKEKRKTGREITGKEKEINRKGREANERVMG